MNYEGFEELKNDLDALSKDMHELNEKMRMLARKYYWNGEELIERVVGQMINDLQVEQENIYRKLTK